MAVVGDENDIAEESRKRTIEVDERMSGASFTEASFDVEEGVGRDHVAESTTIEMESISRDDAGAAATDPEKTRPLKKAKTFPFQLTEGNSSPTAGVILPVDGTATDSHGVPAVTADPTDENGDRGASQVESSSEKVVKAVTNIKMNLEKEDKSKDHVEETDDATSNDGTSISLVSKFLSIRRVDNKQNRENKMTRASPTNEIDKSTLADPSAKSRSRKDQGVKKMPVSSTNEIDKSTIAVPADGFPAGWIMRRIQRNDHTRSDCRYFSPKMNYLFRTKPEAQRFVNFLDESNGNEEEAMVLFRKTGKGKSKATVTSSTSNNGLNDKLGGGTGNENARAEKTKRKRKTNATERALQDLH
ncbi:hypothetical protein ACHAXA_010224 [Cyclostephanos tholiformis]|uniref:MBD domain-containing protein n=1 Tax=Cyclostephanos tholiformis TaxID=382380 RepID=A0ABD3SFY5_9STRA